MDISGTNNFGLQAINGGTVTIDNTDGITVSKGARKVAVSTSPFLYHGEKNTEIIKALDNFSDFEAFVAATSYSVSAQGGAYRFRWLVYVCNWRLILCLWLQMLALVF